jgi:hypothetical protein
MVQTKAQRSAAAKKGAETRRRNREAQEAKATTQNARDALAQTGADIKTAAKSVGEAAEVLTDQVIEKITRM